MTKSKVQKIRDEAIQEYVKRVARLGGQGRAETLSPERRREIAQHAARTRWKSTTPKSRKTRKAEPAGT